MRFTRRLIYAKHCPRDTNENQGDKSPPKKKTATTHNQGVKASKKIRLQVNRNAYAQVDDKFADHQALLCHLNSVCDHFIEFKYKESSAEIRELFNYGKWTPCEDLVHPTSIYRVQKKLHISSYHLRLSLFPFNKMNENYRYTEKDVKEWVYIAKSTLQNSKWGLFTSKTFQKDEIISVYFGFPMINPKKSNSDYLFERVFEKDDPVEDLKVVIDPRLTYSDSNGDKKLVVHYGGETTLQMISSFHQQLLSPQSW